jgi:DNA repair exonuclease SbcCD nuclease subunit
MSQNPPSPEQSTANIFVLHMAIDIPNVTPSYIEAEASPELIPEGFGYYAAGHIHERYLGKFKSGVLAYSGCTETASYDEAKNQKGFYHVTVSEKGEFSPNFIELESPRKFIVLDEDFSGMNSAKITELAAKAVKNADTEGAVITSVIRGVLPSESSRAEVDVAKIRNAAEKALFVNPLVLLKESTVSEEIVRSIFESQIKDLKTKAYEYFIQIFSERYSREQSDQVARSALSLIEPLTRKQEARVKQIIEELQK